MRDELEHFKKKYRAYVQEGNRRYAVPKRVSMDPLSPSHEPFDLDFEYEPSVQIDISKRDFERLVEMHRWIEDKIQGAYAVGSEAMYIYQQYERELRIRNENPGVKKAYEKYQTLLKMVDSYYD
jgi:hypothetical protein